MTTKTALIGNPLPASSPSADCADVPASGSVAASVPWWLWPHLLSLDAPIVAVGWQIWWERDLGGGLRWFHHVILGCAVWMVYLADRLADVLRTLPGAWATERHEFVRNHRAAMSALLAADVALLAAITVGVLPSRQFFGGLGLLMAVSGYFYLTHRRGRFRWLWAAPKETIVGALFAVGTGFFPLCSADPSALTASNLGEIVLFGLLCFLNCALIARWERSPQDLRDPASLLNAYPRLTLWLNAGCLAAAVSAAGCAAVFRRPALEVGPLVLGALGLWALDQRRDAVSKSALRVLADAVLLGPWVLAWLL